MKSRQSNRIATKAVGTCSTANGVEWTVAIDDLSASGCRIEAPPRPVAVGERVKLAIAGSRPHAAEIAWQRDGQIGLQFAQPLNDRVLRHLARAGGDSAPIATLPSEQKPSVRRIL